MTKNIECFKVRYSKISHDFIGPVEIQERDWPYLIEKLKARAEDLDISDKVTEKKSNTLKETQNNYKIVDESTVHYINVLLRISKSTLELKN